MRITIDRREWLRGETGDLRSTGYLWDARQCKGCFVGLLLRALGVPIEFISGLTMAGGLGPHLPISAEWLLYHEKRAHPDSQMDLYEINDDLGPGVEMEGDIIDICAANGLEVEFHG